MPAPPGPHRRGDAGATGPDAHRRGDPGATAPDAARSVKLALLFQSQAPGIFLAESRVVFLGHVSWALSAAGGGSSGPSSCSLGLAPPPLDSWRAGATPPWPPVIHLQCERWDGGWRGGGQAECQARREVQGLWPSAGLPAQTGEAAGHPATASLSRQVDRLSGR